MLLTLRADDVDGQTSSGTRWSTRPPAPRSTPTRASSGGSPAFDSLASYAIRFRAGDGQTFAERTVTFTVVNANVAPVFDPIDRRLGAGGRARWPLQIFAFDADNPHLPAAGSARRRHADGPGGAGRHRHLRRRSTCPAGAAFDAADRDASPGRPTFAQAGTYVLRFTATDDGDGTGQPLTTTLSVPVEVRNANRAPVLPAIDAVSVAKGQVLEVPVVVTDADGDPLQLMVLVTLNGLPVPWRRTAFRCEPTARTAVRPRRHGQRHGRAADRPAATRDRGDYVGDDHGRRRRQRRRRPRGPAAPRDSFVVEVQADGRAAAARRRSAPRWRSSASTLQFTVRATDLDQDALQFSAQDLPRRRHARRRCGVRHRGLHVDADGRRRPAPRRVTFTVTDSTGGSDTRTIDLVVRAANAAPVLLPVGNRTVAEGAVLDLQLAALDSDGDVLTWSAHRAAAGCDARPGHGPDPLADELLLRRHLHRRSASRSRTARRAAAETISITVTPTNQAPQFSSHAAALHAGAAAAPVHARRPPTPTGTRCSTSPVGSLPQGAEFDASNGRFAWIPDYDQAGELRAHVQRARRVRGRRHARGAGGGLGREPRAGARLHAPPGRRSASRCASRSRAATRTSARRCASRPAGCRTARRSIRSPARSPGRPGPGQVGDYLVDGQPHRRQERRRARASCCGSTPQPVGPDGGDRADPELPGRTGPVGDDQRPRRRLLRGAPRAPSPSTAPRWRSTPTAAPCSRAPATGVYQLVATATDLDGYTSTTTGLLRVRDPLDSAAPRGAPRPCTRRAPGHRPRRHHRQRRRQQPRALGALDRPGRRFALRGPRAGRRPGRRDARDAGPGRGSCRASTSCDWSRPTSPGGRPR